jgi:endoglucanase
MMKVNDKSSIWSKLGRALSSALCLVFSISLYAEVPPLTVSGNHVLVGGKKISLGGNSLFWSNDGWGGEKYYTPETVGWLKQNWQSTIIRAAMGVDAPGGYLSNPSGNKQKVERVIDAALANDMYVIIDWHSHHAENHRAQAENFFREMAQKYGHHNNIIYEVYNEPLQVSWSHTIKPYAEAVIAAIRQHDPDNLIIVGTPSWSQNVDEASHDPISDPNVAYALHFYAGTHGQWLRDKAQTAMNNGIALFVTEWGTVNANGDGGVNYGETDAWVSFMRNHGIHHANWAINDKQEGASALHPGASPGGGWTSLTPSGNKAREIILGSDKPDGGSPPGHGGDCDESSAVLLPATIEAESFCEMQGIQTESTADTGGGLNVGWIDEGDWMAYRVNVPEAGEYVVSYRVASLNGGGRLQLEQKGGNSILGQIDVPVTHDWQSWVTVSHTVSLEAGAQNIALAALSGGFNVNWFDIKAKGDNSTGFSVTIQAEDFSWMSGIQTEATSDNGGGLNVGWIDSGDWFSFNPVNIPRAGRYKVEFRVASLWSGGELQFDQAGGYPVFTQLSFPATGGWQNWTTVEQILELPAGNIPFGIFALQGGWNINWIRITEVVD